jgi:hypothetical protein
MIFFISIRFQIILSEAPRPVSAASALRSPGIQHLSMFAAPSTVFIQLVHCFMPGLE